LNTDSDEADVTSLGRPFHTFAPPTGKARPPIVDRRQVGTSSCSVEADLSLRRCGMSSFVCTEVYKKQKSDENTPKKTKKQKCSEVTARVGVVRGFSAEETGESVVGRICEKGMREREKDREIYSPQSKESMSQTK